MNAAGGKSATATTVRWGLVAFVFVLVLAMAPQTNDPTEHIKLLALHAGACVLAIVLIAGFCLEKRPFRPPGLFFVPLALFLALNFVAALNSEYRGHSLNEFRMLAGLFVLYGVASQAYTKPGHIRGLLAALCLAVGASSVYGLAQKAGFDPFPWADKTTPLYRHLPATFGNPNLAGHAIILTLVAAAYLMSQRRYRWVAAPAIAMLAHLGFTGHRAGFLALATVSTLTASLWFVRRKNIGGSRVAAAFVVCVAIGISTVAVVAGLNYVSKGSLLPLDNSLLLRFNGYQSGASMILDKPFIGHGPGVYVIENPAHWTPFEQEWFDTTVLMNRHAHNEPIEVAIDAGIGAAALYLLFLLLGVLVGIRLVFREARTEDRALGYFAVAIFTAFFVDSLFGFNLRAPVSASILFLVAGAIEGATGVSSAPKTTRPGARGWAWRGAAIAAALALVAAEARVYLSELHFQRARGLGLGGQLDAANLEFEKAESLTPWNWRIARLQGMAYYEREDFEEAVVHLARSATVNPNWMMTILPLSNASLKVSTSPDVPASTQVEALERSLENGRQAFLLNEYSRAAAEIVARASFTKAVLNSMENKNDAESLSDWRAAEKALILALNRELRDRGSFEGMLGRAQLALGKRAEAETHFVRAIELDDATDIHWAALHEEAKKSGNHDVFSRVLDRRLTLSGHAGKTNAADGMAYYWLGRMRYEYQGDADGAQEAFALALNHSPNLTRLWKDFARFAIEADRREEFRRIARKALASKNGATKNSPPGARALAVLWEDKPKAMLSAAEFLLRYVQKAAPKDPIAARDDAGWAADYLLYEMQTGKASPRTSAIVMFRLGQVYSAIGDHEIASQLLIVAAGILEGAEKSECVRLAAQSALSNGRGGDAVPLLKSVLSNTPGDLESRLWLARCLTQSGNKVAATEAYSKVLRSPKLSRQQREAVQGELQTLQSQAPKQAE